MLGRTDEDRTHAGLCVGQAVNGVFPRTAAAAAHVRRGWIGFQPFPGVSGLIEGALGTARGLIGSHVSRLAFVTIHCIEVR
jgi:hypothetical protein